MSNAKCPICDEEIEAEYYKHMMDKGHFDEIKRMRKAVWTIFKKAKESTSLSVEEFQRACIITINENRKKA
jgi:hypothetical protein